METSGKSILPQKTDHFHCDQEIPSAEKRKKGKNDRRFSDEQIKSLEFIFKQETKLDSRKKLQLARDLGLQPRQIAIWFQNRRARWKSKQIEQEYKLLKANYDNLNLQFDDLKREKRSLQMQLQELSDAITNFDKDKLKDDRDSEVKESIPNSSNKGMEYDHHICAGEDVGDEEKIIKYFGRIEEKEEEEEEEEGEEEVLSWGDEEEEREMKCLASSTQTWSNLSSGLSLFDPCSGTSNWWKND